MKQNELDNYSTTRILRRCGQLDISFEKVIDSPYFSGPNRNKPKTQIQYKDGVYGYKGWGKRIPLTDKDIVPFNKTQLLNLLGYL
jgi:hypothetical protein